MDNAGRNELHARAGELFLKLRQLAPEQREAELVRLTAGDDELRAEVCSLLEYDSTDLGPSQVPGTTGQGLLELPERIGPYRVLRPIGRGGSGQVFLAEQDEPVQRRVAIKVVPAAAHSAELAARLYVERRSLERADHPNIARILDAGQTVAGLPYLVMEYVEGPSITAYCTQRKLDVFERVTLFLDVIAAVQHAHQRGVIHRDLKPANLLVTEVGGKPCPKVLDFGIAKPIEGSFGEVSPPTLGLPMGTPSYMAPEQTGFAAVDTRADVYALGALLYELLAGRPPLVARDPVELLRRIRDTVPEPASRAQDPNIPRGRASRALLADLDVVLAKALEKDPMRRFRSVAEFGADLERALARLPIEARPASLVYRASRFAERNRALTALGALAALALIVGFVGLVRGLRESQRREVEVGYQLETLDVINRFLIDDLLLAASPDRAGPKATVEELLERASGHVEDRLPGRPAIAAAVHHALASAYAELSVFEGAQRHGLRALELRRAALGQDTPETVRSEILLASLLVRRQRYAEALESLTLALERAREVLGHSDRDTYTAQNDLGVALLGQGRARDARWLLEEALAGRSRLFGPADRDVIASLSNLALCLDECGDSEASLELLRETLRRLEVLADPPRFTLLGILNNIGATLQGLDRDREALPYYERATEVAAGLLGPDHVSSLTLALNRASLESEHGDPLRAAAMLLDVVQRRERLLGPHAKETFIARHGYWTAVHRSGDREGAIEGFEELLGDVLNSLGAQHPLAEQTRISLARCLLDSGRAAEALPHALEAEGALRERYGAEHSRAVGARAILEAIHKAQAQ